jgi:phospholipase/carboxylesterase
MTTDQPSPPEDNAAIEAFSALLRPLLHALDVLGLVGRRLHPGRLAAMVDEIAETERKLQKALEDFNNFPWPAEYGALYESAAAGADNALKAFTGLREARDDADGALLAYRALRHAPRAHEAIYPLAGYLTPVSQFFLNEESRGDKALLEALAARGESRQNVGVMHAGNEKFERGGFSLYVPETYDSAKPHPVVVALHGGAGHGRAFLWTWLRQARSRGVIILSPTARGGTWSLMDPEIDAGNIAHMLAYLDKHWNIDKNRLLLTGMSDGGTFCYLCGLMGQARFSHLAPVSASFQAMLLEFVESERLRGMPVYLTHGALDWMFPIDIARQANRALTAAGARVTYREIEDLSHTYPVEENGPILDWFLQGQ